MTGFLDRLLGAIKASIAQFEWLPPLLMALAVLVVGWLIALVVSALVRRLLRRTELDNQLVSWVVGEEAGTRIEIEKWTARGDYYLIMLFVLVATSQALGFSMITEPLNQMLVEVFTFAPRILSAGLLLLLAWVLASAVRMLVTRLLKAARVDDRLGESSGLENANQLSVAQNIGNALYWLIFLIFLPAALGALGLHGLLAPVRDMTGKIVGFLPNLLSAALILLIGWFAARIVQRVTSNLLAATGIDSAGERAGLGTAFGGRSLSGLSGLVVYTFILILATTAALEALKFEAISRPASEMLTTILEAVPAIFTAGLVLLVAYLVGRFLAGLVTELLTGIGFNAILARLGLGGEPAEGQRTPAQWIGYLTLVALLLFAAIEAAGLLGFHGLAGLLVQLTTFIGHVILGVVIFGIGLFLANLSAGILRERGGSQGGLLSIAVRGAILTLAAAMALRQMGLASDIINLAFGLLLGAVAIAVAIAFGLGSREIAAREVERWLKSLRENRAYKQQ
ncbi:MAG: mechanosensitive ion channel [bacterium]|nr:mechanosensitive ion channel [bacterium]